MFSEKIPADQSTTQQQQGFVDIGSPLVTDAEAAELIEPSKCSFHYPAPFSQAATVLRLALCQERSDAADAQTSPYRLGIVGSITQ